MQLVFPALSILRRLPQLGVSLALTFSLSGLVYAADALGDLEQTLFSHGYTGESSSERLNRLESSVFGGTQAGSESERIARLQTVLKQARQVVPATSTANTSDSDNAMPAPQGALENPKPEASFYSPPPAADATDYPTVTALERQVFGRDFIRDSVQVRLDRLEKKTFGQNDPQAAMADRVDKLLSRYPGVKPFSESTAPTVSTSPIDNLPNDPSQFRGSDRDVYLKVDALERNQFNGKTFPNGLLSERLDRLEKKTYGRAFSGESIDTRVTRLLNNYRISTTGNATPASPSNGTIQRPAFQNRPAYQPAPSGMPEGVGQPSNPNAPRNIQFGSGFSSSSNSTYNFSPEMMSMLPPNVRSQMAGGGNGTVAAAPSTVIIERQSVGTPGFQTYGGAPMQYYNYYGAPGQMQSQTTTTVIQPNGGQIVYGYPGNQAVPGNPNGLPNPAYAGDPALLQRMNQLESQIFGQPNPVEPVQVRLSKLENQVMGQMYPTLPEPQRLENLEKAYRMQAVSKLLKQTDRATGSKGGAGSGGFYMGVPLGGPSAMNPMTMPVNPGIFFGR